MHPLPRQILPDDLVRRASFDSFGNRDIARNSLRNRLTQLQEHYITALLHFDPPRCRLRAKLLFSLYVVPVHDTA
jgi:hypothetical protein